MLELLLLDFTTQCLLVSIIVLLLRAGIRDILRHEFLFSNITAEEQNVNAQR